MPRRRSVPPYRLHRYTGQALVHIDGRDIYLGAHGSPESMAKYEDLVRRFRADQVKAEMERRVRSTSDFTIAELVRDYLKFARTYYVKNGKPTSEYGNVYATVQPLLEAYADKLACHFSPRDLKAVREQWIGEGIVRNQINKRVDRIRRMFSWGVEEGVVDPDVLAALREVKGLRRGRTPAAEGEKVRPVPDADVDATFPYLASPVRAMVELQRLTGARPGEIVIMRACDIVTEGANWEYVPQGHKTEHFDRERRITIGPRAQEILAPWLDSDPEAFLFSPADAVAERSAERRVNRKTPLWPSHLKQQSEKRQAAPKKQPGARYSVASYRRAIAYAIGKANRDRAARGEPLIPAWHPHQLRHSTATRLRREFGLDVARAVLGHSSPAITAHYAELDQAKAAEAMSKIG